MAGSERDASARGTILKGFIQAICLALFAMAARADGSTLAEDGKEIFESTCAHCHGPDAVQAESRIDLRLLRRKYGERMEEMYFKTVTDGRPSKGMPAWKYVFTPGQIAAVIAYLKTVQSD